MTTRQITLYIVYPLVCANDQIEPTLFSYDSYGDTFLTISDVCQKEMVTTGSYLSIDIFYLSIHVQ